MATKTKPELHTLRERPARKDPKGDGWSVDIMLVSGDTERKGYYDPKGSIAGGKYFYYKDKKIEDCDKLKEKDFPTHWYYVEEGV